MATKIIIKNSSVAGKVPDASALNAAELAVNLEDQKLYSKDANGNVFELGRGSTDSGGTGDRPTGPEIGDLYFDTDLEILLVWNGSEWEQITTGGDSLWVEDAGKLYPVTLTNDVQIGGTAAAPNISLNANGTALLGINGSVNGRINLRPGSGSDTSIQIASGVQFGDYFQIFNDGTIKANSSGDADRDPNYTLDASDGSADFAGKITAASTEDTDGGDTVVTKDYLEGAGSGGTGTLGYWDRTGTTLSPVNQGDNVLISNASDGQVYIDKRGYVNNCRANGLDIVFKGGIGADINSADTKIEISADGTTHIGGTLSSAPNISLNASDGSASFLGDVAIGDSTTFRDNAAIIAALPLAIRETFKKALSKWEKATPYVPEDPTTLPADETLREAIIRATTAGKINLNANDGSATFAGGLTKIYSDGGQVAKNYVSANSTTDDDGRAFEVYQANPGSQTSADLKAMWTNVGDIRLGGTLTGASRSPKVELRASDGAATFAGRVYGNKFVYGNADVNENGWGAYITGDANTFGQLVLRDNRSGSTDDAIGITILGESKASIAYDGSAEFAGKITAADYNLEALPPLSTAP